MTDVYVGMTVDVLHHGHINILNEASKLGKVTVGLLTDSALDGYKRLPFLTWKQRKEILEALSSVDEVVPQDSWDYSENVRLLKPKFFVHGSDWLQGEMMAIRENVISALEGYGGRLIEVPYTQGVSATDVITRTGLENSPFVRGSKLRRLLASNRTLTFTEAHSAISAHIIEVARTNEPAGKVREFDGFWSSSLTDSTSKCMPDIEALSLDRRLEGVSEIFSATTKPLIFDADTGGKNEHLQIYVKEMERLGISACIIEDKTGLKKNSLFGNEVPQEQEDPARFAEKIIAAREAKGTDDFMIVARIESLILDKGISDALSRADTYVEAGADGVMIHSRSNDPTEIFEFSNQFKLNHPRVPLVVVPTSFNSVRVDEFEQHGIEIVIYANHMLRASFPAMQNAAQSILENRRSFEVEKDLMSIADILNLIPGTK